MLVILYLLEITQNKEIRDTPNLWKAWIKLTKSKWIKRGETILMIKRISHRNRLILVSRKKINRTSRKVWWIGHSCLRKRFSTSELEEVILWKWQSKTTITASGKTIEKIKTAYLQVKKFQKRRADLNQSSQYRRKLRKKKKDPNPEENLLKSAEVKLMMPYQKKY